MKFIILTILAVTQVVSAGFYAREASYNGEINSNCEYDEDCVTPHAYCRNNRVCECKKKYQYDPSGQACFPTQLGLKCHVDGDCTMANSRCFEEVCQCRSNHVAAEPSADCLPSSRLQASCVDDSQCRASDDNSHCNTQLHTCDCMPNYHPAFDTQQCVPSRRLKETCTKHQECSKVQEQQDKVECRQDNGVNRCVCRSGFSSQNNICVRGLDGGASSTTISVTCISILTLIALLK